MHSARSILVSTAIRLVPTHVMEWAAAIVQIRKRYRRAFGRNPRLLRPRTFSEKMQWRKLFEPGSAFTTHLDKLAVRRYIADRVSPSLLIPLLWSGTDPGQLPFDELQTPYVIKSNHACGHVIMVRDAHDLDRPSTLGKLQGWLDTCFATIAVEPGYKDIRRQLLVEQMIRSRDGSTPIERRLFVFGGRVRLIQTTSVWEDGVARHTAFHTPAWERLPWLLASPRYPGETPRPERLDTMIAASERLAEDMAQLRVDFYDCGDTVWIGELTVYSWSGLVPFKPPEVDTILGDYWTIDRPLRSALRAMATRRYGMLCIRSQRVRS